jgi:hypothetical protein
MKPVDSGALASLSAGIVVTNRPLNYGDLRQVIHEEPEIPNTTNITPIP